MQVAGTLVEDLSFGSRERRGQVAGDAARSVSVSRREADAVRVKVSATVWKRQGTKRLPLRLNFLFVRHELGYLRCKAEGFYDTVSLEANNCRNTKEFAKMNSRCQKGCPRRGK